MERPTDLTSSSLRDSGHGARFSWAFSRNHVHFWCFAMDSNTASGA